MLPELLAQVPPDEKVSSVSADGTDGADDTKACHEAIAHRGAQATIPLRKNAQVWKSQTPGAMVRNEAVLACKRLGWRIWKSLCNPSMYKPPIFGAADLSSPALRTCSMSFFEIALECNRDEWVTRMRRMGSCPCQQMGRSIARFHSNPSGKCLLPLAKPAVLGRSAALQRLSIAGLWTAHCALHPIPKRHLCNSKKTLNLETAVGCTRQCRDRCARQGARTQRAPARKDE